RRHADVRGDGHRGDGGTARPPQDRLAGDEVPDGDLPVQVAAHAGRAGVIGGEDGDPAEPETGRRGERYEHLRVRYRGPVRRGRNGEDAAVPELPGELAPEPARTGGGRLVRELLGDKRRVALLARQPQTVHLPPQEPGERRHLGHRPGGPTVHIGQTGEHVLD